MFVEGCAIGTIDDIRYARRRALYEAPVSFGGLSFSMSKIAVMIDGGHLRACAKNAKKVFNPLLVEKVALNCCMKPQEDIHRILYYDCAPYTGTATLPVSGTKKTFTGSDKWLHDLAKKDLFAVRRGILKFRGYVLVKIPYTPTGPLTDADFRPSFEQKGVDMRIGLDMAIFSANRAVVLIALITNDTDCIPAMKHARRSGLQVALLVVPGYHVCPELLAHVDFTRKLHGRRNTLTTATIRFPPAESEFQVP